MNQKARAWSPRPPGPSITTPRAAFKRADWLKARKSPAPGLMTRAGSAEPWLFAALWSVVSGVPVRVPRAVSLLSLLLSPPPALWDHGVLPPRLGSGLWVRSPLPRPG